MKVTEAIGSFLLQNKINCIFGVSGANIEELYSHLSARSEFEIILAKSEYNAVMMAVGYYLKHKSLAAVLTTSGAGVLNTISALCEAFSAKIPLFLIAGRPPSQFEGKGAFQDTSGLNEAINLEVILGECTAKTTSLSQNIETLPLELSELLKVGKSKKKPICLLVNKDLFSKDISVEAYLNFEEQAMTLDLLTSSLLVRIREKLFTPEKKLIILGEELIHECSKDKIEAFAQLICAKIVTSPSVKGFCDYRNRSYLGSIGVMGNGRAIKAMKERDYLIFLGANYDLLTRLGYELNLNTKMVTIVGEQQHFIEAQDIEQVHLPPMMFVNKLISDSCNFDLKGPELQFRKNKILPGPLNFKLATDIFNNFLKPEHSIFVDAGNTGAFFTHYLRTYGESCFYISLGMGGMGNSIGAAIGATLHSSSRSFVFIGDGSFLIHGLEIHTAIEHTLPITFVILNNNSHGMCSTREELFLNGNTGVNDFKKTTYGQGLGEVFHSLESFELDTSLELVSALNKTTEAEGVVLLSLNIIDKTIPPFRGFRPKEKI